MRFDPKKEYAIVYGDPVIRYEQERRYFDGYGNEISEEKKIEPTTTLTIPKRGPGRPRKT